MRSDRRAPFLARALHPSQHGDHTRTAVEASATEQARHAADQRREVACESASAEGGAAVSEPRRQHERCARRPEAEGRRGEEAQQRTQAAKGVMKRGPAKRSHATRVAKRDEATENPEGGLTAKGRAYFRRIEGAHLRPGVKKAMRDMTPTEMRRKGSWAVRFYGRASLPPLRDANGEPTRFALTAAAWGEPIPKTVAAARRIAAKGEHLLAAYRRRQQEPQGSARTTSGARRATRAGRKKS
jgi:hypothetical protein